MKLAKFILFKIVSKMYRVILFFGIPSFETPFSPLNIHILPKGHNTSKSKETYDKYYLNNGEWNQDVELFNLITDLSKEFNSKPSLLDMGCGLGDLCFNLENTELFSKITGIDISSVSIKKANEFKKSHKSSSSFFTSGIDKTNFSKSSFSIITSIGAHEHLKKPDFSEIKRLLPNDGICIMVLPACGPFHPNRGNWVQKGVQSEWWYSRKDWEKFMLRDGLRNSTKEYKNIIENYITGKKKRWTFILKPI